jgi:transcription elongation GreA/GreB family factor
VQHLASHSVVQRLAVGDLMKGARPARYRKNTLSLVLAPIGHALVTVHVGMTLTLDTPAGKK